jgi:hypothetical protein
MQSTEKSTNYIFGGTVTKTNGYAEQFMNMEESIQTKNFSTALETSGLNLCCIWGLYVVMKILGIFVLALSNNMNH